MKEDFHAPAIVLLPVHEVRGEEASPGWTGNVGEITEKAEERADAEEEPGRRSTPGEEMEITRMTKPKTGSKRRRSVVVVRGGRVLPEEVTPSRGRGNQKSQYWPS